MTQPTLLDERVANLDPGTPLGGCTTVAPSSPSAVGDKGQVPQVFTRKYTRLTVTLDCAKFEGRFEPAALLAQ